MTLQHRYTQDPKAAEAFRGATVYYIPSDDERLKCRCGASLVAADMPVVQKLAGARMLRTGWGVPVIPLRPAIAIICRQCPRGDRLAGHGGVWWVQEGEGDAAPQYVVPALCLAVEGGDPEMATKLRAGAGHERRKARWQ